MFILEFIFSKLNQSHELIKIRQFNEWQFKSKKLALPKKTAKRTL